MRIMALDYGDARTGVAISDADGLLVGYTAVLRTRGLHDAVTQASKLAAERNVEKLVVGFPLNMNGSEGVRAELCTQFALLLEETSGLDTEMWDERRTTVEAHEILHANGRKEKDHRSNVDAVAASLILEGYLQNLADRLTDDSV